MEGKAYAESQLGIESEFYFEFPKKKFPLIASFLIRKQEELEEYEESIGTDFTILVVEDNEDMRNFVCQFTRTSLQKILQCAGFIEFIVSNT